MTTRSHLDEEPDGQPHPGGELLRRRRTGRRPDAHQVLRVLRAGPVVSDDYEDVRDWAVPVAKSQIHRAGEACGLRPTDEDARVVVDEAISSLYGNRMEVTNPAGLLCTTIRYRVLDRVRSGATARSREVPFAAEDLPGPKAGDRSVWTDTPSVEEQVIDRILEPQTFAREIEQIQELLTDARAAAFMIVLASVDTGESIKDLAEERGLSYGAVRKAAGQARRHVAQFTMDLTGDEFDAHSLSLRFARDNLPVGERADHGAAHLSKNGRRIDAEHYLALVQSAQTKITEFRRRSHP